jgi:two-component system, response regulator PdtaR
MSHALIIDDNMVVSRAIQSRLAAFGFDSFDHTWTEQQALEAAGQRRPDLIVVGDHLATGSPLEVARELAFTNDAPILAVTTDRFMFQHSVPEGAKIDGPYPLSELDQALACSRVMA